MEKKKKIVLEYQINSSTKFLYERISSASGLSEWFADDVNINNDIYCFFWGKSQQEAKVLSKKKDKSIKLKWLDDEDDESFFEFSIANHELTGDVILTITDFVFEDEEEDAIELWNKQINKFKRVIGA